MRFKFQMEPWMLPILLPFGAVPEKCYAELHGRQLHVKMGVLFQDVLELNSMSHVEPSTWPVILGLGHRVGLQGQMGVLASHKNVVRIHFKEPQFIKFLGAFHFKTHDFYLALEDADGFVDIMSLRLRP